MNFDEFQQIDSQLRKNRLNLFRLSASAPPARKADIQYLELCLKIRLPIQYKEFLQHFGGGEFGLINIFCADSDSDWYLLKKVEEARRFAPNNFIPVSDDYAGGYYGFEFDSSATKSNFRYWNFDGGTVQTKYSDLLEFVVRTAYGE